jgi:hypothetical protein
MKKIFMLCVIFITCSSCSQFSLLASGTSIAISQNAYAKMYNGADILTIISTEKSIKGHAYDSAKKAWTEVREGKTYIYDKTWGLTD